MYKFLDYVLLFAIFPSVRASCEVLKDVSHTFYGYPDNDPPGPDILYNCGRGNSAGGIGTYDDPLTFATGTGEFEECEIIYVPYLQKYLRNEDFCATCDKNWEKGVWHIDVWTGSAIVNGAEDQVSCENTLTPSPLSIVRRPGQALPVNESPLYSADGGSSSCNVGNVFMTFNGEDYC
ncbi:uncharacterized protein LDX57_011466 [Aspergillus melleus]|uniref:uncharacterized protein n=1 Tax=Aspergillus melleus TaxID=138277 RepID=UPI001E8CB701|nr:uncharacterized protein LDX57_011466 [Aspergillus melleus]KAH8433831.1 hypothetical protein LDX57_011466 [Aspergillus melleus]